MNMRIIGAVLLTVALGSYCSAIEEAEYVVVEQEGSIELRDYQPHILAEVLVEGEMDEAGNMAFRTLYNYIAGDNIGREKIAMTAPVGQKPAGEKIAMTAPVGQRASGDKWAVSFMMPAKYTMDTIPQPKNPAVKLRQVPARRVAAIEYSGFWSVANFEKHRDRLEKWLAERDYRPSGEVEWARYDPPFMPWFMRRNEVLIPVAKSE
jgi:hypothetical protein